MNEYLRKLVQLIEQKSIDEGASLTITANEGEPAVVQVRFGMEIHIFIENEDQTKLDLVATRAI